MRSARRLAVAVAVVALAGWFEAESQSSRVPTVRVSSLTAGNAVGKMEFGYTLIDDHEVPKRLNQIWEDATDAWPPIVAFPSQYLGLTQIRTRTADALTTGTTARVQFTLSDYAFVCPIHDDRIVSKPTWLTDDFTALTSSGGEFVKASLDNSGNTGTFYCSDTAVKGAQTLRGNCPSTCSGVEMYPIVLLPGYLAVDFGLPKVPTRPVLGTVTAASSTTLHVLLDTPSAGGDPPLTYVIERSLAGANSWTQIASGSLETLFPDAIAGYVATGLTASTAYDFRAKTIDSSASPDHSPYSLTVTGTTNAVSGGDTTPPTTPGTPTTSGVDHNSITWTSTGSTDASGIDEYIWYWAVAGSGCSTGTSTEVITATPTLTINTLNPSTTYYARLKAKDNAGIIGELTPRVCATTSANPGGGGAFEIRWDDFPGLDTGLGMNWCPVYGACEYDEGDGHISNSFYCNGVATPDSRCLGTTEPFVVLLNGSRALQARLPALTFTDDDDGNLAWRSEIVFNGPAANIDGASWEDRVWWFGWENTVQCTHPCPFTTIGQQHGVDPGYTVGAQGSPVWGVALNGDGTYAFYRRLQHVDNFEPFGQADGAVLAYYQTFGNQQADIGDTVRWALRWKPSADANGLWALYYNCSLVLSETNVITYVRTQSIDNIMGPYKFGLYVADRQSQHGAMTATYDNWKVRAEADGGNLAYVSPGC